MAVVVSSDSTLYCCVTTHQYRRSVQRPLYARLQVCGCHALDGRPCFLLHPKSGRSCRPSGQSRRGWGTHRDWLAGAMKSMPRRGRGGRDDRVSSELICSVEMRTGDPPCLAHLRKSRVWPDWVSLGSRPRPPAHPSRGVWGATEWRTGGDGRHATEYMDPVLLSLSFDTTRW